MTYEQGKRIEIMSIAGSGCYTYQQVCEQVERIISQVHNDGYREGFDRGSGNE